MLDHPLGIILNENKLEAFNAGAQRLYLIAGASRSGTSALAYAMRRAGVNFGNVIDINHEPHEAMKNPTEKTIRAHIASLSGPSIGAKLPAFTWHLKWMDAAYHNAMFFFVVRNPLDIAKSVMKRDNNYSMSAADFAFGLEHAWNYYLPFAQMAAELTRPVAVISYEKMKEAPGSLFDLLAAVGIEVKDAERLASDLSEPGYRAVSSQPPRYIHPGVGKPGL